MEKMKSFLKKKNVEISVKRYLVDALGAMAQGLFASLLIGTIVSTLGKQLGIEYLTELGGYASAVAGPAMAVSIGWALQCPPLVLFSLVAVGNAANILGGAGGAAVAGCCAQMVGFAVMSYRENGVGGLVSQGIGTSMLQMGNIVKNPRIWIAPTLASAITGPIATCIFHMTMNGTPVSSGMGTCGLVGQIGVYTGWMNEIEAGTRAAITGFDWAGLILICFVLPAVLSVIFCEIERKMGWIKDGDLKLD